MNERGATQLDWYTFDFVLGLGANLLPCVPFAPDVRVVAGSALEGKVGKIPSQFNANGEAHGLLGWQKREITSAEIKLWGRDRRLNICVRTGPISGIYAFDVDIDDTRSDEVFNLIEGVMGPGMFARVRKNSRKFLVPFYMDEPCKKRKIYLQEDRKGPAVELLADGQQFVAAGSHSSGARYEWLPDLPTHLPVLTLGQVNQLWQELTSRYAKASTTGTTTAPSESNTATTSSSSAATASGTAGESRIVQPGESTSLLTEISESDWLDLRAALRFLLDKVADNDTWSQVGYALLSLEATRPARQLWIDFSKKAVGYEDGAPEAWWEAHQRASTRTDYRHIFTLARQRGYGATSSPEVFAPVKSESRGRDIHDGGAAVSEPGADKAEEAHAASGGPDGPNTADSGGSDILSPAPDRPVVRLIAKDFSKIIDQIEEIAKPEMYTQGPGLVTLSAGHEEDKIERDPGSIMLIPVTKAYARKRLGELAYWFKFTKNSWDETGPSVDHVNTFIDQGSWRKLRPLDAIARAPFVRKDGSICDEPGYDKASRALLIPSASFPGLPRSPSRDDAVAALGRLRGVFHQFPWASDAAESGFLAHVLSEAGRLAFNKCPMFFYNAPTAGTGKTLLQKSAAIIAHGSVPALRPWVSDGDEVRKTVYASLLAGDRSLLFDNVPDGVKIRSAELCAAITAELWQDRKLGESESRGVPNRAVFSASGNNVNPAGDLARRSIIIRLDANTERLSQRRFDIEDLESYLVRERPNLLVDALTIIRAYHRTDVTALTMPVPLASFEQWSHFVREPLIWLGLDDPIETQKKVQDEDTESVATAFNLLRAAFGDVEFTGVDVARKAGGVSDQNGALTNALISTGCKEPNSPSVIGYWLRGNRDKVFGGMKLVGGAHSMSGMKWKFVKVE